MRAMRLLTAVLALLWGPPALSQWFPPGPMQFVEGSAHEVEVRIPIPPGFTVHDFEAIGIKVVYPAGVFEPLTLARMPGTYDALLDFAFSAQGPEAAEADGTRSVNLVVLADPRFVPLDLVGPGVLYQAKVSMNVLADVLPANTAMKSFPLELQFAINEAATPSSFGTMVSIVAVPEPHTWGLLLAGLAVVVGFASARVHRRA